MAAAPALRSFGWFVGLATATLLGAAALAAGPAWLWKGAEGLQTLAAGLAICFVGAVAGRAAQHGIFRSGEGPQRVVNAMLGGLGVRMFVTLGLALGVIAAKPFEVFPFVVWLMVGYVALLGLEVFVAMREFGQNQRPDHSSESPDEASTGVDER